jgi:predicted Fe-Mo cluster-binding NifX family protein
MGAADVNAVVATAGSEVQFMKVVVTAQGTGLDSPVDPRFGRARYFVLVDTDSGEHAGHDNAQNLNAPQGAGIQAAQTVARLGAEAVLTGHVGPKAFATLRAAGIAIYAGASGTVREAIDGLTSGRLQPVAKADVEGHWT